MYRRKHKLILAVLFSLSGFLSKAQGVLTLTDAITIGLKNNYDIILAKNIAEQGLNNNTPGNAGMLPQVSFLASTNLATNATKQEFSNGLLVDKSGVKSNNINAGIYLNWTLFDGMKMFATKEKLEELEARGGLNTRLQIETTIAAIMQAYYDMAQQKQLIRGINENIQYSQERLRIAEKKFEIGTGSKLDVLQAKTDMNAQTSSLYRQQTTLENSRIALNQLLGREVSTGFDVNDSIPVNNALNYDAVFAAALQMNSDLQLAKNSIKIAGLEYRETKSLLYPRIGLAATYLFARSQNQAGFSLFNQNLGFNIGLNASYNLFNGWNTRTALKNAKLNMSYYNTSYQLVKQQVNQRVLTAWNQYRQEIKILNLEEDNVKLTKEALDIALERFRLGAGTTLELKDVQRTYEEALVRLTTARYNTKVAETTLMRLNGDIINTGNR
jgi:outer membrane protein